MKKVGICSMALLIMPLFYFASCNKTTGDSTDDIDDLTQLSTIYYQPYNEEKTLLTLPVIYYDFIGYDKTGSGDGYINASDVIRYGSSFTSGHGHPDFERINANSNDIVAMQLGFDGFPVLNNGESVGITNLSFDMWYKNYLHINKKIISNIVLTKSGNNVFGYASSGYFPIDGKNMENVQSDHTFTDYMTFYIKYKGKGSVYFHGNDDVWIFVNGRRALDLGGCHLPMGASFTLASTGERNNLKYNENFDILEDDFVEIKLFHAKRYGSVSVFELRLTDLDVYLK